MGNSFGRFCVSGANRQTGRGKEMTAMPYMPKYLNIKKENKTMTDYPNNISTKLEIIKASEITPKEVRWL